MAALSNLLDLVEGDQSVIVTAGNQLFDRDARYERVCELFPKGARIEMDEAGNIIVAVRLKCAL